MASRVTLTPKQLDAVVRARALAVISSGDDEGLAAFIGHADLATVYPAAYSAARHTVLQLLQVVDELTGAA